VNATAIEDEIVALREGRHLERRLRLIGEWLVIVRGRCSARLDALRGVRRNRLRRLRATPVQRFPSGWHIEADADGSPVEGAASLEGEVNSRAAGWIRR